MSPENTHIGDLHDLNSHRVLESLIPNHLPALIRADGSIHSLTDPNKLLQFSLAPNDLYLVGPHGEIVPFISLAIKQQLLQGVGQNSIFHIDAHPDNCQVHPLVPHGEDCGQYIAMYTQRLISDFLGAEDHQTITAAFEKLVDVTRGDIATFLNALAKSGYFYQIAACLREPNEIDPATYPFTSDLINWYFNKEDAKLKIPINRISQTTHISVYSIDADFCECHEDQPSVLARHRFFERLEYLLQGLNEELEKTNKQLATIYTISLDPQWCAMPREFLMEFITRFYRHLTNCHINSPEPQILSDNLHALI